MLTDLVRLHILERHSLQAHGVSGREEALVVCRIEPSLPSTAPSQTRDVIFRLVQIETLAAADIDDITLLMQ